MRDAKNARFLALASLLLGFGVGCGRAQDARSLTEETPPEQALTRTSVTVEPPIPGEGPLLERNVQALPFHSHVSPLLTSPLVTPPNSTVTPRPASQAMAC